MQVWTHYPSPAEPAALPIRWIINSTNSPIQVTSCKALLSDNAVQLDFMNTVIVQQVSEQVFSTVPKCT